MDDKIQGAQDKAPINKKDVDKQMIERKNSIESKLAKVPAKIDKRAAKIEGDLAKKPRKPLTKKMIGIIVAIVAVILIGGGVSAYQFWYQNPDKVLNDALAGALLADGMSISDNTTLNITNKGAGSIMGVTPTKISFNTTADSTPAQVIDMSMTLEYDDEEYVISGKGMYDASGNIYYQISGVLDIIKQIVGNQFIEKETENKISSLEGKWVKYSIDDMKKDNADLAKTLTCAIEVSLEQNKNHAYANEVISLYQKTPFFEIDKDNIQTKDGQYVFDVRVDQDQMIEFMKNTEDSEILNKSNECAKQLAESADVEQAEEFDEAEAKDALEELDALTMTVSVDQMTHALRKVEIGYFTDNSDYKINVESSNDVTIDNSLKVEIPAETVSHKEWMEGVEEAATEVFQAYYEAMYSSYYGSYYSAYPYSY